MLNRGRYFKESWASTFASTFVRKNIYEKIFIGFFKTFETVSFEGSDL